MMRARQFFLLALRECGDHLRNGYVLSMLGAAVALATIAVYVGVQDLAARSADHESRVTQRLDARHSGLRTAGTAVVLPLRVLRAPTVGASVVRGLDGAAPAFWDTGPIGVIEGHAQPAAPELYSVSSALDIELLVRWILGLSFMLLGADSLVRARRTGLLKTLATYPVPPRLVIAGKLVGGAGSSLILAMVLATVAGLSAHALMPREAAREATAAALLVGGAGWLFLSTMFAAGATIGILVRSPQAAIVTALTLWLIIVVAVPAAGLVARAATGVQSRSAFESERAGLYSRSITQAQREMGGIVREWVGAHGETRGLTYEGELRNRLEARWKELIQGIRAELDALESQRTAAVDRQRRVARLLRFASPGALLLDAASALAGTGSSEINRTEQAVEAYQGRLQQLHFDENRPRLNLRIPELAGESLGVFDRRPGPMAAELPWFDPEATSLRQRLIDAGWSLAALAGYFATLSAVAIRTFRYRRDGRSDRD